MRNCSDFDLLQLARAGGDADFDLHLRECAKCRSEYDELRAVGDLLRGQQTCRFTDLRDAIMANLRPEPARWKLGLSPYLAATLAVHILVFSIAAIFYMPPRAHGARNLARIGVKSDSGNGYLRNFFIRRFDDIDNDVEAAVSPHLERVALSQNADGSWDGAGYSNVYLTSLNLLALNSFNVKDRYSRCIDKGSGYLAGVFARDGKFSDEADAHALATLFFIQRYMETNDRAYLKIIRQAGLFLLQADVKLNAPALGYIVIMLYDELFNTSSKFRPLGAQIAGVSKALIDFLRDGEIVELRIEPGHDPMDNFFASLYLFNTNQTGFKTFRDKLLHVLDSGTGRMNVYNLLALGVPYLLPKV